MADDNDGIISNITEKLTTAVKDIETAFATNFNMSRVSDIIEELDKNATDVIKTFGQGRENAVGISQALADSVSVLEPWVVT